MRSCSDSEQQHQREQRVERIWMPHPTSERVNLRHGGNFWYSEPSNSASVHTSTPNLSRVLKEHASARGLRTAKPKLSWFSQFLVALFRIFGKATRWSFEDLKTHQVAHWRWRFFGSRGKKTIGGSVSNAFPPSDGLLKCRKCVSAAAASSGFARVQDRAATW